MDLEFMFDSEEARLAAKVALLLGALLLLLRLLDLRRWVPVYRGTRSIPLAPGCLPLFGHALSLARGCSWGQMYDWLAEKGPIVKFRVGVRQGILVADPASMKRIVQTRQRVYTKDTDFSYKEFLSILGTGLVTANGKHWQNQRILMAPAFRIDMLDAILPIAARAVERLAVKLRAIKGTEQTVDMEEEFRLLTLQVIGEAILSLPPEECDRVFPPLYLPVMEESNRRVLQPWRHLFPRAALRYRRNVRALDGFIKSVIRARREGRAAAAAKGLPAPAADILDHVLASIERGGEPWTAATETQLCFEVKTFLLAGHETSAAMLCWSLFELSRRADLAARVRAEAREAGVGPGGASPRREAVEAMELTLACLKESLRKYSVVPVITRNLIDDDELCGHKIPAGSWIIMHVQKLHHHYRDPLAWDPARFLPGGEYDQFPEELRPYMFMAFIQGPRNCLGQYFALLEARVVLGALLEEFSFAPVDAERQAATSPTVIPVGPVHGMAMRVT